MIWIGVLHKPTPQGGRIVVGGSRGPTSIFGIELLTSQGTVVADYYHPGWLWAMRLLDLDGDGFDEIILGGVNDAYASPPRFTHRMTLIVLDSRHVEGQGPAPAADDRHFVGLSSGRERAVLFFGNFGRVPGDDPNDFCLFSEIRPGNGHFEALAISSRDREIGAHYQFDNQLNLEGIVPTAALAKLLDAKIGAHATQIERSKAYLAELGEIEVLKNDFKALPPSARSLM